MMASKATNRNEPIKATYSVLASHQIRYIAHYTSWHISKGGARVQSADERHGHLDRWIERLGLQNKTWSWTGKQ